MAKKPLSSTFPSLPEGAVDVAKDLQHDVEKNAGVPTPQKVLSEQNTIEFLRGLGYDHARINKFLGKAPS